MATVHDVLARARAAQQKIPAGEAGVLFAAVMRLAASQAATLRSRLVQIEASGMVSLVPFDSSAADDETGYLAPELLEAEAPAKTEPRVQVYAAGALGYELLTGKPPPDPNEGPDAEPPGPLGDLVRVAMAKDRRERFASLVELRDAIDGVQKPIPPEQERHAFATLLARSERWGGGSELERAALAKLIEQTTQLHRQVDAVRVGIAEVQREHRELEARFRKLDSGGKTPPILAPRQRSWPAGFLGGFLGALVAAATLIGVAAVRPGAPQAILAALGMAGFAERKEPPAPMPRPVQTEPKPQPAEAAPQVQANAAPAPDRGTAPVAVATPAAPAAGVAAPAASAAATPAPAPAPTASESKPLSETKPAVSNNAHAAPVRPALALLQRGERELERGRVDAAVDAFRLALQDEPKLAAAWRGLGTAYVLRHDNEPALAAYQKYLQLSPAADDRADIRRAMAELNSNAHASVDK
jgi:hypothetical protein